MDVNSLRYDQTRAIKSLKKLDDGSVFCTEPLTCVFPKRFVETSLAQIKEDVEVIGVLGFITEDNVYFSMLVTATYHLSPSSVREMNIEGARYVVLEFDKGDNVFKSTVVVKDPHLNNKFFDEFIYYGKLPWYISADKVNKMFDRDVKITGRVVSVTPQCIRMLSSIGERDPNDISVPYRYSESMEKGLPPRKEGLNNVSLLIDGTFNKLIGGYSKDTLVDALLTDDDKVTSNEKIMKGEYF